MRESRVSPEVHLPIWTISMNNTTNDHDEDLPNYQQFTTSHIENAPPSYFDISNIPTVAILHYSDVIPYQEPSKAKIFRKHGCVNSADPLLEKNPDQLWLYFLTYLNEKPRLLMNIRGEHDEPYIIYDAHSNILNSHYQGNGRTRVVIDFNYSIDLTAYISEHYWRMAVIPSTNSSNNSDQTITFRDALEEYTHSNKSLKEICCRKQLAGWNYDGLRMKVKEIIRSTGYNGMISINFSVHNGEIFARKASMIARFSQSICTQILCFFTCLFLIFLPIYIYLRRTGYVRHQIVADYQMILSTDVFLRLNKNHIIKATLMHSKGRYKAIIS